MGNEKHKEENILFVHFVNFPPSPERLYSPKVTSQDG